MNPMATTTTRPPTMYGMSGSIASHRNRIVIAASSNVSRRLRALRIFGCVLSGEGRADQGVVAGAWLKRANQSPTAVRLVTGRSGAGRGCSAAFSYRQRPRTEVGPVLRAAMVLDDVAHLAHGVDLPKAHVDVDIHLSACALREVALKFLHEPAVVYVLVDHEPDG